MKFTKSYKYNEILLVESNFLNFVQAAVDAKYYGNTEVYNLLKARGAKAPVWFSKKRFVFLCS